VRISAKHNFENLFVHHRHCFVITASKKRTQRFETKVAFTISSLFLLALTIISLFLSAVGIDFDNGHLRVCRSERSNGRAALFFFPVLGLHDGVNRNGQS
jgi:hypothetical protein